MKKEQRNRKVQERASEAPGPKRPRPPYASAAETWSRVEVLLKEETQAGPVNGEESKPRKRKSARVRRRLRSRLRVLDVIAVVLWTFIFTKLFIADVDRFLVSAVAPGIIWVLDYRIVFSLLLLALVLLLFQAKHGAWGTAYVATYPFVVVFWKIPTMVFRKHRYLRKRGYWVAIAVANAIAVWTARGRWIVLAIAIVALSSLTILLADSPIPIYSASLALLATLAWALIVGSSDMVQSSRFISAQQRLIGWILDKKFLDAFLTPKRPDKLSLKDWTLEDAKAYRDTAGNALLVYRGLWFWAYAIDQYRKGPALVILNIASVTFMLVQVVFVFTFINAGVYMADPSQFVVTKDLDWWTWIYYSGSAMTFGEIASVVPIGGIATIMKLLNAIVGGIGVLTIAVTFLVSVRSSRTENAADGAVRMLKKRADRIDQLSSEEYGADIESLDEYLVKTAWALNRVAHWLYSRLPAEFRHGR